MTVPTLLVVGAGGHGRSVADAALSSGRWKRVVFADDRWPALSSCQGFEVISDVVGLFDLPIMVQGAIAAVGDNVRREAWCKYIEQSRIPLVSVVHPRAFVSDSATIGSGCAIMPGAIVGTSASLGRAVIVNAGAIVDHDVTLADFAHIGVGVALAGGVHVGSRGWLQAGVSAGYGVVVADGAVVEPGIALSAL